MLAGEMTFLDLPAKERPPSLDDTSIVQLPICRMNEHEVPSEYSRHVPQQYSVIISEYLENSRAILSGKLTEDLTVSVHYFFGFRCVLREFLFVFPNQFRGIRVHNDQHGYFLARFLQLNCHLMRDHPAEGPPKQMVWA